LNHRIFAIFFLGWHGVVLAISSGIEIEGPGKLFRNIEN